MGPNLIVHPPPLVDCDLRIDSVLEPLHPEAFISELPIEALIGPVLPWLRWVDRGRVDPSREAPQTPSEVETQLPRRGEGSAHTRYRHFLIV